MFCATGCGALQYFKYFFAYHTSVLLHIVAPRPCHLRDIETTCSHIRVFKGFIFKKVPSQFQRILTYKISTFWIRPAYGASIKYVRRNFGFWDPLPSCPQIHSTSPTELYVVLCRLLGIPPSPSARTYLMEAPYVRHAWSKYQNIFVTNVKCGANRPQSQDHLISHPCAGLRATSYSDGSNTISQSYHISVTVFVSIFVDWLLATEKVKVRVFSSPSTSSWVTHSLDGMVEDNSLTTSAKFLTPCLQYNLLNASAFGAPPPLAVRMSYVNGSLTSPQNHRHIERSKRGVRL